MPIKKQGTRTNRGVRKKTTNNKTILSICAAVFLVVIIVLYFVFRGPSEIITNGPSKKTEKPESEDRLVVPVATEDFQAAVSKAKIKLESVDNNDIVKVIVEKTVRADNKEIIYMYEWSINGQPAGSGNDSVSGFKRGDKVVVKITPFEGKKPGSPRTLTVDVQNTTPKVSESKEPKYDGKTFTAQINASDPDGDVLSYELLSGPEGMIIDKNSGMVNWPLKGNNSGDYPVKVKISDGHGGEIIYQLTATIPKESPPPVTVPKKSP
jgi:hypothetical protein